MKQRRTWLVYGLAALTLGAIVLFAVSAAARPGGGSSYSGGGSRSSGGGGSRSSGGGGSSSGGGDGGLILELLFWLCIQHPAVGIPLVLILAVAFFLFNRAKRGSDWSSSTGHMGGPSTAYSPDIPEYEPPEVSTSLEPIQQLDPSFSRIVFEDFVYSLYAEVHRARGMSQLNRLSAYLSPAAAAQLQHGTRGPVEGVIVGAMRIVEVSADAQVGARVVVELESNYSEAGRGCYAVERWTLARGPKAKSRTPDKVRVLGCPNCGAPQEALFSGTCKHCGRVVNDGTFDWTVQVAAVLQREERPPILTSSAEEVGTDAPTVRDYALPNAIAALRTKDPAFEVNQFQARVGLIFQQFQLGWSNRDLAPMRPFMSDALFTTQTYWVQAYLAQKLRNVTENAQISRIELVKVTSDAFFDAVTVRVFASSLDYTVTEDGRMVAGNRSRPRAYSEYWTLIRGTNRKGPTRTELACANCGGPLDVNMTGHCKFCKVKVTTGDFDWVLSRIEQDESYSG